MDQSQQLRGILRILSRHAGTGLSKSGLSRRAREGNIIKKESEIESLLTTLHHNELITMNEGTYDITAAGLDAC